MTLTKEEAKKMEGTEFTYIFSNGDTMPAYVKKVDTETGRMSCWSFSLTTDRGHVFAPLDEDEEKEGACCLIASIRWSSTLLRLSEIHDTGAHVYKADSGAFPGCPF